jgi:hypothetical protein
MYIQSLFEWSVKTMQKYILKIERCAAASDIKILSDGNYFNS